MVCAVVTTLCGLMVGSDLEAQVAVRDSLQVVIVETEGQRARTVSEVAVQREPALQIGGRDIADVTLLRGGRIVVLDRESSELRFYDLQGEFISRRGGYGARPGAFVRPSLLQAPPGD